jgi:hypothetical protein
MPMQLRMMLATKRHCELITNLSSQGARLRKFQVVRIAGSLLADHARLGRDKSQMSFAAAPNGLWE